VRLQAKRVNVGFLADADVDTRYQLAHAPVHLCLAPLRGSNLIMSKDVEDVRWLIFAWIISAIVFVTIVLLWNVFS
jgi:hypothetical protein